MKILVVDDSHAMRMIVQRTLRAAGYGDAETTEAENGKDALAKLEDEPVNLVLSDWNMPEMNGLELLESLRASGNDVKFGFVTTEATPDMRLRAKKAGANFLIAKPFTPKTFEEVLNNTL